MLSRRAIQRLCTQHACSNVSQSRWASEYARRCWSSAATIRSHESQSKDTSVRRLELGRSDKQRVVILGSGWAGYTLARRLDPQKYQVVLISPRSYFVFTPLLASTSVGTLEFRSAIEPIRRRRKGIAFVQGWADAVDLKNKTVLVEESYDDLSQTQALVVDRNESGSKQRSLKHLTSDTGKGRLLDLEYDKLVIAVGCYNQTFNVPGVKENAMFLKDIGDARKIRSRLLSCFEMATLPELSDQMRKYLLNFAVVGGGPTGIEFSAELHDIIKEDLAHIYPELMQFVKISVYDVAPTVLSMFDKKLGKYAMDTFAREGIQIKTSHHVEELRPGTPRDKHGNQEDAENFFRCLTLRTREEGEIGVGMVVWSTGLMMNPFVEKALGGSVEVPSEVAYSGSRSQAHARKWQIRKHEKTSAVLTDDRLRVILEPFREGSDENGRDQVNTIEARAILKDVYAIGDCASLENTSYPATAQVANQKGEWLAKRLNNGDIDYQAFSWKNMGIMAYLGNWNAILQGGHGGNVSGRAAWFIWRGAYLTKSVSVRNKVLIPVYWLLNWMFGRDISRF